MTPAEYVATLWQESGEVSWKLKSGEEIEPSADDIQQALDEAQRLLYTESIGTRCSLAGLIVERTETGCDTYAFTGSHTYKENNEDV